MVSFKEDQELHHITVTLDHRQLVGVVYIDFKNYILTYN